MMEEEIKSDIYFIAAIHEYWIFPHFKFLQLGDPLMDNKPGYIGRLMAVRYYLMHRDLCLCENDGWMDINEFKTFTSHMTSGVLNVDVVMIKMQKAKHLFNIMKKFLIKHFDKWTN